MAKKRYHITRKQNVSELLNSSKTKKNYIVANKKRKIINLENIAQFGGKLTDKFSNKDINKIDGKIRYRTLKLKINLVIKALWVQKLAGVISEKKYRLTKRIFRMQMYLARIGLVYDKLINIIRGLILDENSLVLKIRDNIRTIFDLQKEINTDTFSKGRNLYTTIKKQDKLRKKLNKYSLFKNDKDLGKNCKTAVTGRARQAMTAVSTLGISLLASSKFRVESVEKRKGLICMLGKYRKYEGKFNKYYKKFNNHYTAFTKKYKKCAGAIKDETLHYLDVEKEGDKTKSVFDETICDDEEDLKNLGSIVKKAGKEANKKTMKTIEKTAAKKAILDKAFLESASDFKAVVRDFNKKLDIVVEMFNAAESFGVRHYKSNMAKSNDMLKGIKRTIFRMHDKILIDNKGLNALAKDKTFITKFTKMIGDVETDSKNLLGDMKFEIVIPNIYINVATLPLMKVLSINFANMKYDGNSTIYENLQIDKIFQISTGEDPDILCVQNCEEAMLTVFYPDIAVNEEFFYIPVAFAKHPKKNKADDKYENKYNVIFIHSRIIDITHYKIRLVSAILGKDSKTGEPLIKPIDQTEQFTIALQPTGVKLEDVQKSFASANLCIVGNPIAAPPVGDTFINVVTTELIGSNPREDLKYIQQINSFEKINIIPPDIQVPIRGLRAAQINEILMLNKKYLNILQYYPDIFCGDFGGFDDAVLVGTLVRRTEILNNIHAKVKALDPAFIGYNDADINIFYNNGLNLLPLATYTINTLLPVVATEQYLMDNVALGILPLIYEHTKEEDYTISNFIYYKTAATVRAMPFNSLGLAAATYTFDTFQEIMQKFSSKPIEDVPLTHDSTDGIFPAYISLNLINPATTIPDPKITRVKTESNIDLKLYTEEQLKYNFHLLDRLMSNFSYGYKAYLKRDLGCLNYYKKFKNKSVKVSIKLNDYGRRWYGEEQEPRILIDFYTMNYPSIIEMFLYQLSGFFENTDPNRFYSESQLIYGKRPKSSKHIYDIIGPIIEEPDLKENNLDPVNFDKKKLDILLRLLLIPSKHLKAISGIDIRPPKPKWFGRTKKPSTQTIEPSNLSLLTNTFCNKFYRTKVQLNLEDKLTEIMKFNTLANLKADKNFNLFSYIKEIDNNGNLKHFIKKPSGEMKASTLIMYLFEYINIMIKLKYVDKVLNDIKIEPAKLVNPIPSIVAAKTTYDSAILKTSDMELERLKNLLRTKIQTLAAASVANRTVFDNEFNDFKTKLIAFTTLLKNTKQQVDIIKNETIKTEFNNYKKKEEDYKAFKILVEAANIKFTANTNVQVQIAKIDVEIKKYEDDFSNTIIKTFKNLFIDEIQPIVDAIHDTYKDMTTKIQERLDGTIQIGTYEKVTLPVRTHHVKARDNLIKKIQLYKTKIDGKNINNTNLNLIKDDYIRDIGNTVDISIKIKKCEEYYKAFIIYINTICILIKELSKDFKTPISSSNLQDNIIYLKNINYYLKGSNYFNSVLPNTTDNTGKNYYTNIAIATNIDGNQFDTDISATFYNTSLNFPAETKKDWTITDLDLLITNKLSIIAEIDDIYNKTKTTNPDPLLLISKLITAFDIKNKTIQTSDKADANNKNYDKTIFATTYNMPVAPVNITTLNNVKLNLQIANDYGFNDESTKILQAYNYLNDALFFEKKPYFDNPGRLAGAPPAIPPVPIYIATNYLNILQADYNDNAFMFHLFTKIMGINYNIIKNTKYAPKLFAGKTIYESIAEFHKIIEKFKNVVDKIKEIMIGRGNPLNKIVLREIAIAALVYSSRNISDSSLILPNTNPLPLINLHTINLSISNYILQALNNIIAAHNYNAAETAEQLRINPIITIPANMLLIQDATKDALTELQNYCKTNKNVVNNFMVLAETIISSIVLQEGADAGNPEPFIPIFEYMYSGLNKIATIPNSQALQLQIKEKVNETKIFDDVNTKMMTGLDKVVNHYNAVLKPVYDIKTYYNDGASPIAAYLAITLGHIRNLVKLLPHSIINNKKPELDLQILKYCIDVKFKKIAGNTFLDSIVGAFGAGGGIILHLPPLPTFADTLEYYLTNVLPAEITEVQNYLTLTEYKKICKEIIDLEKLVINNSLKITETLYNYYKINIEVITTRKTYLNDLNVYASSNLAKITIGGNRLNSTKMLYIKHKTPKAIKHTKKVKLSNTDTNSTTNQSYYKKNKKNIKTLKKQNKKSITNKSSLNH